MQDLSDVGFYQELLGDQGIKVRKREYPFSEMSIGRICILKLCLGEFAEAPVDFKVYSVKTPRFDPILLTPGNTKERKFWFFEKEWIAKLMKEVEQDCRGEYVLIFQTTPSWNESGSTGVLWCRAAWYGGQVYPGLTDKSSEYFLAPSKVFSPLAQR